MALLAPAVFLFSADSAEAVFAMCHVRDYQPNGQVLSVVTEIVEFDDQDVLDNYNGDLERLDNILELSMNRWASDTYMDSIFPECLVQITNNAYFQEKIRLIKRLANRQGWVFQTIAWPRMEMVR